MQISKELHFSSVFVNDRQHIVYFLLDLLPDSEIRSSDTAAACPQCLSCSSGNSVASVFQTARIFVVCLISKMICLLSVNPGLVWIPSYMLSIFFVFCKSSGLQVFFTRKISLYNILYALWILSKFDAWRAKNFKKLECSPTGSP